MIKMNYRVTQCLENQLANCGPHASRLAALANGAPWTEHPASFPSGALLNLTRGRALCPGPRPSRVPVPPWGPAEGRAGLPEQSLIYSPLGSSPASREREPALLRGRVWHPPATGLPVFLAQRELGTGVILISDPLPEKRAHGRDRTGTALRQPPARRLQEELSSAFPRSPGSQEDRAEGEDRGGGGPARDAARLPRRQTPSAKGTVPGAPHQTRLLGPQGLAHQDSQPPRPLPVTSASWGAGAGSQVKLVPPEQLARAAPLVPSRPAPQIFTPSSQGCSPSNGR